MEKLLADILEDLLSSEERSEVLRTLSFLPPLEAIGTIPKIQLERLRRKGGDFAKAAAILAAQRLQWQPTEAADILRDALAVRDTYPKHIDQIMEFIDSSTKTGPRQEALLVEMLKHPSLGAATLSRVSSLLVKLVERRPTLSVLPDPAVR